MDSTDPAVRIVAIWAAITVLGLYLGWLEWRETR